MRESHPIVAHVFHMRPVELPAGVWNGHHSGEKMKSSAITDSVGNESSQTLNKKLNQN